MLQAPPADPGARALHSPDPGPFLVPNANPPGQYGGVEQASGYGSDLPCWYWLCPNLASFRQPEAVGSSPQAHPLQVETPPKLLP